MPHLIALHLQIILETLLRLDAGGNPLDNLDSCSFESGDFGGVVRHQPNASHAHPFEDGGGKVKLTAIRGEAEPLIGLHGIETLVLELIRAEFRHKTDPAAFFRLIEEDAGARIRNGLKGMFELKTAVAAERAEYIAGKALGVDPYDRRRTRDVSKRQCHHFPRLDMTFHWDGGRRLTRRLGGKAENAKMAPARGKIRLGNLLNPTFHIRCHTLIIGRAGMVPGSTQVRSKVKA